MKKSNWISSSFDGFATSVLIPDPQQKVLPIYKKRRRKEETCLKVKKHQDLWFEKHKPINKTELAVHKKKVQEIENWLQQVLDSSILLLCGSPGTGKSTTLRVLALELHFQIQEWQDPIDNKGRQDVSDWTYQSHTAIFQDFLLRANKYPAVVQTQEKKLIMIEDVPYVFFKDPQTFHNLLRKYKLTGRYPLVFILTDSGNSNMEWQLFPKCIQTELNIHSISFNPVAPTLMLKVLGRIVADEMDQTSLSLFKEDIDVVIQNSCGDLRTAINSLQFTCIKDESKVIELHHGKSQNKTHTNHSNVTNLIGRDTSLYLFRALGKILHHKNECSKTEDLLTAFSPEDILEKTAITGEMFNLYLQQNYLDFLENLNDVVTASKYFTDADILYGDWEHRSSLQDYSASVASRGVLQALSSRTSSAGWKPLHKPEWFSSSKTYINNCTAARTLFKEPLWTPVELQTVYIPFLHKICSTLKNPDQHILLEHLCKFSSGFVRASCLEEKELVDQEEEEEENCLEVAPQHLSSSYHDDDDDDDEDEEIIIVDSD